MDLDAIILAGGRGLRMDSVMPKSLISVAGVPLIFRQIDHLESKVNRIILSLGYHGELVKKQVEKNYSSLNLDIISVIEKNSLGTAGAVRKALGKVRTEWLLVLNVDDIANINVEKLKKVKKNVICVARPRLPFGLVKEKNGKVFFIEKPKLNLWASCGWYLFEKKKLFSVLPKKGSLEYDVLPKLNLTTFKHHGFWCPMNTPKDVLDFEINFFGKGSPKI